MYKNHQIISVLSPLKQNIMMYIHIWYVHRNMQRIYLHWAIYYVTKSAAIGYNDRVDCSCLRSTSCSSILCIIVVILYWRETTRENVGKYDIWYRFICSWSPRCRRRINDPCRVSERRPTRRQSYMYTPSCKHMSVTRDCIAASSYTSYYIVNVSYTS